MKLRHGRIYCPENSILLSDLKSPVLQALEKSIFHILMPCITVLIIHSTVLSTVLLDLKQILVGDPIGH